MPQNFPGPRLAFLALPLLAFAGMFAVLTAINGGSTAPTPAASLSDAGSGPPPEDTAEQISALRETIAAGDASGEVYAQLGNSLYQRWRETGDRRLLARADRAFAAALADDPRDFNALAGRATLALSDHRFADGLALARRAHRAAPGVVAPYAALVDGLIETGRYGAAGQALDRMLSLKPNLASYLRASYYRELQGDLAGAAAAIRLGVSAGSGTVEGTAYVRTLLGDLEARRGRYDAAQLAYREAVAVDPEFGAALTGIAMLRAGRGEIAPAIESLRGQLGSPPSPDALIRLGEVEQAAGLMDAARRRYDRALAIESRLLAGGAGTDAGVTLNEANHGEPTRAVLLGRTAWRTAPSVSSADALSWALYRAGRVDAAARFSVEAMRLGSRDPEFLYHAGMIARANGDDAAARRLLTTLIEQSPRFHPLYAPRAERALRSLG
jgi:tetratricopeptide (TPR) repeat protein